MGGDWRACALGDLIDVKHGFAFPGEFIHDEPCGDILLTPGNFAIGGGFKADKFKYYDGPIPAEFVLAEGDLIVTMTDLSKDSDTLGFPALVPSCSDGRRYLHNQRLGKVLIRNPDMLDKAYLQYRLRADDYRHEVLAGATGTAIKHTSPERIKHFRLSLPCLREQCAIARILGAFDEKIALNRRMSETLEAMARALFKSWFVDFELVRAKAEGRDPGLPREIADLFPGRFVESEIGEIPEGWEVARLGDIADVLRDQENPLESPDVVFHHYSIPAFDEGQSPREERGESIKSMKSRVPAGVVLLSKLNPEIERVWLVDVQKDERAICSTEFLVFRPRPPVGRAFIYYLMRSPLFRQTVEGLVTGTSKSHQRAQVSALVDLAVIRPAGVLSRQFERIAGPLLERTLNIRRESRTLAALRDALLPKLISGQLRVPAAERLLEETA